MLFDSLRENLRHRLLRSIVRSATLRRALLGAFFFAALLILFLGQVLPQRVELVAGEPAPRDILATRDIEDRLTTEKLRDEAARAVREVWTRDPGVAAAAEEEAARVFGHFRAVRGMGHLDESQKLDLLKQRLVLGFNDLLLQAALRADDASLQRAETLVRSLLQGVLAGELYAADLEAARMRIDQEAAAAQLEERLRLLAREVARAQVRPNMVRDQEATRAAQEAARRSVPPVIVKRDELIVQKGIKVTPEQVALVQDLGLDGRRADGRVVAGAVLFTLLLSSLTAIYLVRVRPDILQNDRKIILVGLVGIITLGLCIGARGLSGFALPVAVAGMLLSILLDARMAAVAVVAIVLAAAVITGLDWMHVLVALTGGVVSSFACGRVEQRTELIRGGIFVAAINALTIISLFLLQGRPLLDVTFWQDVGWGAGNGLVSAVITLGLLPFMESLFHILTPVKLLELSNPNHPLLRKLMVEAPGTYHHTILVANLSEAAAEAVGADPLLTRVGAYFHDIGKTKRPYFFSENQFGTENPHDKLPPSLSALIISSHVKDGVEMAREARLPREIISFITEHHGTMLISYFWNRATENGRGEHVVEADFRYEGPSPHSKETAILMLADGCEASVRAMRMRGPLTHEQIEEQVQRVIQDRLAQGQLDHVDLTLRELQMVKKAFVRVLGGAHHARVEYPPGVAGAPPAAPALPRREGDTP